MEDLYREASRQFIICNACRYCEGFCAVFPAIERRLWSYDRGYIDYVANLCHDCRDCFYSCPYVSPNPFSINIPLLLSSIRLESYKRYTFPEQVSRIFFTRPLLSGLIVTLISMALVYLYVILVGDPSRLLEGHRGPGSFYRIIPYDAIMIGGMALLAYIIAVLSISSYRYWRSIGSTGSKHLIKPLIAGVWDAVSHRYFRGGGTGCSYPGDKPGYIRLYLHLSIFTGFMLAILSTISAAIYQELLGILPPYGLTTPPVVLGTAGGFLIIMGSTGLLYLKSRSNKEIIDRNMLRLDVFMLVLLDLIALTGLLVMILRDTIYMGFILTTHMGFVIALFIIAPYSKIIHMLYRTLSLAKYNNQSPYQGMRRNR
ncbi:MAG: tricarballylate utilization 4Fe-4S protein TcuB [Sulfolobales archaeon]